MSIQFQGFRKKKPWVVTWRNPWTGKRHTQGFAEEAEAKIFEDAQADIAAKEKALLRKARKHKAVQNRVCVKDLLDSYFRLAHTNTVTIRQARYHASHIISAFGNRLASQICGQDILNFWGCNGGCCQRFSIFPGFNKLFMGNKCITWI